MHIRSMRQELYGPFEKHNRQVFSCFRFKHSLVPKVWSKFDLQFIIVFKRSMSSLTLKHVGVLIKVLVQGLDFNCEGVSQE